MSSKNKLRFLMCLLFSVLAHSSVLVASLFYTRQIAEDPQGSTLKIAAESALASPTQTLHTVELVDSSRSKSAIPDSVQVAEMARTLPQKTVSQNDILLAKDDDRTAVEIKRPTPSKKTQEVAAPTPPKKKKEIVKKIAKLEKPKTPKKPIKAKVETPKEEVSKEDTVVAQNTEFTPVTEHVDAQASEEPQAKPAPAPEVISTEAPEAVAEEAPEQEQLAPVKAALTKPGKAQQIIAPVDSGDGEGESAAANSGSKGSPKGLGPGGSPEGIRDGDSLAELAGNLRPAYPVEDRRARREGTAVFVARVTQDGRVQDIKLESAATPAMTSAALKAFANYHYKAGQEGWVRKKFVFKLTGESEEPARLRRASQNSASR